MTSLERGTTARISLTNFTKKFSFRNKEYNKVEDAYDTRIPLHNEDAFQHGMRFKAKFIGSLEIARPTCKIDIITAMRRIRYEYKVKGIRKVRAYLDVSVSGVKVTKRKRKRSRKKYSEEQLFIMQHPIYRIFYVSHDSQDLKIFSYITREVPDNTFRCNVFKAYKKGMALHIVRSLGQAFDVCHKLNPRPKKKTKDEEKDEEKEKKEEEAKADEGGEEQPVKSLGVRPEWKQFNTDLDAAMEKMTVNGGQTQSQDIGKDLMSLTFDPFAAPQKGDAFAPNGTLGTTDPFQPNQAPPIAYPPLTVSNLSTSLPDFPDGVDPSSISVPPAHLAYLSGPRPAGANQQNMITENPFTDPTALHEGSPIELGEALGPLPENMAVKGRSRKQSNPFRPTDEANLAWELEKQQFTAQMTLLREQLKQETSARIESQARVEHLLMQNKELLTHLQKLMSQLQQLQTLQLPLATAPVTAPQNPTPESKPDNVESILSTKASATISSSSATATATSDSLPPSTATQPEEPTPTETKSDTPPASGSPPVATSPSPSATKDDTPLLPTLTSTPSPVHTEESVVEEPSDSPIPKISEQSMSLGIDVDLLTTSQTAATNDPFAPQDSEQLTSS